MNVTSRLARKILHLSGPRHMKLHMSHADLATFIGATRETVSKTLSVWKQSGLITMGRSTLTVLDADKLEKISQAEFS
jgi:CRP-like cAMP-binding protein